MDCNFMYIRKILLVWESSLVVKHCLARRTPWGLITKNTKPKIQKKPHQKYKKKKKKRFTNLENVILVKKPQTTTSYS